MENFSIKQRDDTPSTSKGASKQLSASLAEEESCSEGEINMLYHTKRDSEPKPSTTQQSKPKKERIIYLEFTELANAEKFERLVKDQKIKTSFMRYISKAPNSSGGSGSTNNSMNVRGSGINESERRITLDEGQKPLLWKRNKASSKQLSETDPVVLARRQKQIEYMKNMAQFGRPSEMTPRNK